MATTQREAVFSVTSAEIHNAFGRLVLNGIGPVCVGISLIYLVLAFSHFFLLPEPTNVIMAVIAMVTSIGMALASWGSYSRRVPLRFAHLLGAVVAAATVFNSLLHLYFVREPQQTTNLMVALIATGIFLLDKRSYLLVMAFGLLGWVWLAMPMMADPTLVHFAFALMLSSALSLMAHIFHRRTFRYMEILRRENAWRAQTAIDASEQRFQSFMEQSTEGILRIGLKEPLPISAEGQIDRQAYYKGAYVAECNDALAKIYGHAHPHELLGRPIHHYFEMDEGNAELFDKFVASGFRLHDDESIIRDIKGNPRYILHNVVGVVQDNQLVEVWSIQRDVTEKRRTEEMLRQTQKMESLGLMSGGIAHDFNNLLVAMMVQNSLAQDLVPSDHPAQAHLARTAAAAQSAADLTQQLLAYSGSSQRKISVINLNTLIQSNLDLLMAAVDKKVLLETDLAPDLAFIEGDAVQIQQVVMNLIINSAEAYAGQFGHVMVRTCNKQLDADAHKPTLFSGEELPAGSYVMLKVSDSGMGMSAETLSRIFDPFFTTKFTGRGLGLAATMGIVKGHDGGIVVESQPQQGTTFCVYFPSTSKQLPNLETDQSGAALPSAETDGLILVIDDEPAVREALVDILALKGLNVVTAANGREGLALFEQQRAHIRLVLLDLSMPGLSGSETLEALREMDSAVSVIVTSGYTEQSVQEELAALGVTDFLSKPYTSARLVELIKKHLTH